jgi:hypothetical protein
MPHIAERIAATVNAVLASHGISETVSAQEFSVTDRVVFDGVAAGQRLSSAIINSVWPPLKRMEGYHFTSKTAAASIISSQTIRLANIAKRIDQHEVSTFCQTHGLDGYLDASSGQPAYRELIEPNTYYASFADVNLHKSEEASFRSAFGPVRLKFLIEARNPDFRRIRYEGKQGAPIPVIAALQKRIKSDFARDWVLAGISRLCCFYLPGDSYGWEREMRVLWRVWSDFPVQPNQPGPDGFVELTLGQQSLTGFKLTLIEVCADDPLPVPAGVTFVSRTK